MLRLKSLSERLKTNFLTVRNLESFFIALRVSDHAYLHLHLRDSRLTHIYLIALCLRLAFQGFNRFHEQLTVVSLLPDIRLALLVIGINLGLDF